MKHILAALTAILCLSASGLWAEEIGGVKLPDEMMVKTQKLILNGAGLRTKFFVKVYAGGLYMKQKSSDADAIIAADEPMAVRMVFIHDGVAAEKLIKAWNEGFGNTAAENKAAIQTQIDQFNSFFTDEAKKGDIYDFIYTPKTGTAVTLKSNAKGTLSGLAFKQALFGIWLGAKPADKGLKKGMLGQ
jgi:hypothetical protein